MQHHAVQSVDPHAVDAIVREARRQRSEYICGLIGRAFSALRRRLTPARRPGGERTWRGTPRTA